MPAYAGHPGSMTTLVFTPELALAGGLILGMAVLAKLVLNGRVLGISGAVLGITRAFKGLVPGGAGAWRVAFLAGLVAGSFVLRALLPHSLQALPPTLSVSRAGTSGLLVGLGVALGNGCTSGHGICGNARLSPRSLAYTLVFMAAGGVTAAVTDTLGALNVAADVRPAYVPLLNDPPALRTAAALLAGCAATLTVLALASRAIVSPGVASSSSSSSSTTTDKAGSTNSSSAKATAHATRAHNAPGAAPAPAPAPASAAATAACKRRHAMEVVSEVVIGVVFALGLGLSGMTQATKVAGFLSPASPAWDLSLMFVMGGAVMVAAIGFQGVMGRRLMARPLLADAFSLPSASDIDTRLLTGGVLFGVGWGLAGVCPGPALASVAVMTPQLGAYLGAMVGGMAVAQMPLSKLLQSI